MTSTKHTQWFLEKISDRAHVPQDDATGLVQDFVDALAGFLDSDQLQTVVDLIPIDVEVTATDTAPSAEGTIDEFLTEMAGEEAVADGRAAEHARAVAETLGEHAGKDGQAQLQRAIPNTGILALFEDVRGDMTPPEAPTDGAAQRHDDINSSDDQR